ncbi:CsgE family curli-type amyloid fiber assembly protein [Escherichia coli]|uniref:CsgE family curli-type amyloid fiber assembly protein n=1 Tax=Escherichia coli TaxID=562 RepID=UPI003F679479
MRIADRTSMPIRDRIERNTHWITITVNQDVIFQTFLFPLKRDFEKTVVFALIQTEEALNRRQINQALLSTGDLAHDEF